MPLSYENSQGNFLVEERDDRPDYAKAISAVRDHFEWTQAEMAENVDFNQAEVSRWEAGKREPTRQAYEQLYMLAYDLPEGRLFWERAGLTKAKLSRLANALKHHLDYPAPVLKSEVIASPGTYRYVNSWARLKEGMSEPVAIPLLADAAAAGAPQIVNEIEVKDTIFFSSALLPHPETTRCFRVSGDSMSPILEDGYIVAVDTFTRELRDLVFKMVVASDPSGGITIKWLRKIGREYVLVPQHVTPRHDPVILRKDSGWRIVGEVKCWIGVPAASRK